MTVTVHGPGGVTINFPDGTDAATINQVMRQATGGEAPAQEGLPDLGPQARGRMKAAFRAFTNPFGISDELGGIASGVGSVLGGGSFGEGYNEFTTKARAIDDELAAQYPGETLGGMIMGGVRTGAPAVNMLTVPAKVAKTAPVAERALGVLTRAGAKTGNAAATGGVYGAVTGAASAEGGPVERAKAGLKGGAWGATTGAGIGMAGGVLRIAGNKIADQFRGVGEGGAAKEAARRVAAAQTIDAGSPERAAAALEKTQQAGIPMIGADLGEASRTLADDARNTSIEGRALLDRALNARKDTQLERTIDVLERAAPGVNAPKTREFLQEAGRAAKRPAYRKAYSEGDRPIWSPRLEQLTGSPAVVDAMRAASIKGKDRAITEGYGAFNPAVKVTEDGQVIFGRSPGGAPTYPNLQFWDYTKRELDQAARQLDRAGRNDEADVTRQLARALRNELDQHVSSYREARATAAEFFDAEDALEAGSNFVTQRGDDFQGAQAALEKMSVADRSLFKEGFVQTLINKLREKGDRANITNSIFLASPAARERIRLALGESGARELEALLRFENIFVLTKNIQGNSATARRLFQMGIAGGMNYGLPAGVGLVASGGDPFDPKAWVLGALAYGARRGRLKIDQNVAREVARLLASDNPRVVHDALNLVAKSPSMLQALRIGENEIARAIGTMQGSSAAKQPADSQDNQ